MFTAMPGSDHILDFVSGTDKIDLATYGIMFANVSTMPSGMNTIISVDSDNNGMTDFQITLINAGPPAMTDYMF